MGSFSWSWPSGTAAHYADLNDADEAVDPQLSWDAVAGAARYDLEINPSQDFAVGSKVCCTDAITGTSYSPPKVLPNNTYYWRVRPIDPDANAGGWTTGQPFTKAFDAVATPIRDLRVENSQGAGVAGGSTPDPVVRWTPVPGASGYEVRGYQWTGSSCNFASIRWDDTTEAPAWTPLGNGPKPRIGSGAWPAPSTQAFPSVARGLTYCVQVRAYTDTDFRGQPVVGPATDLRPAFTYAPLPAPGPSSEMQASDYLAPLSGTVEARMPVFTWKPVAQASGYYVVVARDPDFTKVIDVAFTTAAAYAPRLRDRPISYADETTHYYWAVVPEGTDGVTTLPPAQDSPRIFDKRSTPPALLAPGAGAEVPTQPVFRWTPAEGARNYRLQVATDPDFGDLLEDATTASTAFTTGLTYPADTALYWRVRANDDAGTGLTWSDRGRFVRRLPAPVPPRPTRRSGRRRPCGRWSPVDGATGYDVHLDQGDGTQSDLATSVAAFSATAARGVGIINWKVRARFPSGRSGSVFGGYGAPQSFVRSIPAPAGAKGTRSGARLLVSWQPVGGIKSYRVEVSASSGFGRIVDSVTTDLTTWAPDTSRPVYVTGGRLYWRIRALDTRNAAGAAATGAFTLPRSFTLSSAGLLRRGHTSSVTITVRGAGAKAMRGVGVRVAGAGVRARTKRTGRRGTAAFRLRPSRRGTRRRPRRREGLSRDDAAARGQVATTLAPTHGRSSFSALRIARVAGRAVQRVEVDARARRRPAARRTAASRRPRRARPRPRRRRGARRARARRPSGSSAAAQRGHALDLPSLA